MVHEGNAKNKGRKRSQGTGTRLGTAECLERVCAQHMRVGGEAASTKAPCNPLSDKAEHLRNGYREGSVFCRWRVEAEGRVEGLAVGPSERTGTWASLAVGMKRSGKFNTIQDTSWLQSR